MHIGCRIRLILGATLAVFTLTVGPASAANIGLFTSATVDDDSQASILLLGTGLVAVARRRLRSRA